MKENDIHSKLRADIEEFSSMVLRIAVQNTRSYHDAQDIVQETFLRLMDNYDRLEDACHKKSWLIRVTINLCRDLARRRKFSPYEPLDNYLCFEEQGFGECEVMDMLRRLPENQRNALYLHVYEGLSIKEISELTGRNPHTVGSDIHRAEKRLRLEFDE